MTEVFLRNTGEFEHVSGINSLKTSKVLLQNTDEFELPPGVSLRAACTAAQQYLADQGIEDAAVDAWYLLEHATGISRASYLADRDRKMSKEQQEAYADLVSRRGAHIPLQHLTGEQEFMGLSFLVNEHVLIPRQDTETLVELALKKLEDLFSGPEQDCRKLNKAMRSGKPENFISGSRQGCGTEEEPPQACPADILPDGQESPQLAIEVPSLRVLDLCTGSGCIAISIAKLWEQRKKKHAATAGMSQQINKSAAAAGVSLRKQKNAAAGSRQHIDAYTDKGINIEMYASDISEEALAAARENARRLGADVSFFQGDLFAWDSLPGADAAEKADSECRSAAGEKADSKCESGERSGAAAHRFDIIVSNPPYIRTDVIAELAEEVRSHEPRLALDGGEDGLDFYRRILRESPAHLRDGGWLLLEIGYDQGEAVSELMRKNGFSHVQVAKDLPGQDRVVSGQWMDGKRRLL